MALRLAQNSNPQLDDPTETRMKNFKEGFQYKAVTKLPENYDANHWHFIMVTPSVLDVDGPVGVVLQDTRY